MTTAQAFWHATRVQLGKKIRRLELARLETDHTADVGQTGPTAPPAAAQRRPGKGAYLDATADSTAQVAP